MRIQLFLLMIVLAGCGNHRDSFNGFERFEGTWMGSAEGKTFTETWKMDGQRMYGQGYLINGKDTLFGESLVVGWVNGKLVYIADVKGQDPVMFTAKETEKHFVFENREHDFPQRITYVPKGENELQVLLEGVEDQQPINETISFKKQP